MKKDKILPTPWEGKRGSLRSLAFLPGTKCGVKIISLSLFCGSFPAHTHTHTGTDTCVRRAQATLHAFNVCLFCYFIFFFVRFLLEMQIVMVRYGSHRFGYAASNLCDSLTVGNPGRALSKRPKQNLIILFAVI